MVYFDQILHSTCIRVHVDLVLPLAFLTIFLMDEALLSTSPALRGRFVKMLITLEVHGIFGSNFAYLFVLTLSSHWFAKR